MNDFLPFLEQFLSFLRFSKHSPKPPLLVHVGSFPYLHTPSLWVICIWPPILKIKRVHGTVCSGQKGSSLLHALFLQPNSTVGQGNKKSGNIFSALSEFNTVVSHCILCIVFYVLVFYSLFSMHCNFETRYWWTDQPTDRLTNLTTDIVRYRAAIAAKKYSDFSRYNIWNIDLPNE